MSTEATDQAPKSPLPEEAAAPDGRTWSQVVEGTDEYCDFWAWCGFVGHPEHRTLAQVLDGSVVSQ